MKDNKMSLFEYQNPSKLKNEEFKKFQENPTQWMQKQIRLAVAHDPLVHTVYKSIAGSYPKWISDEGSWKETKEFYVALAFHALLTHNNFQKEVLKNNNLSVDPSLIWLKETESHDQHPSPKHRNPLQSCDP